MKWCPRCKVEIRGHSQYCPLCQGRVTGEGESPAFPIIPSVYEKYRLFFQILFLSGVAICVGAVTVGLRFIASWTMFLVFASLISMVFMLLYPA